MAKKSDADKDTKPKSPAKTASEKAAAGENFALDLPGSPCSSRGGELVGVVRVKAGTPLDLFFQVCASPAQLAISIHNVANPGGSGNFIFGPQKIPPPNPVLMPLILDPGRYIVQWGYVVVGSWEVVAEVHVGGAAVFRKLNTHQDNMPINSIFAAIEVLP